MKRIIFTGIVLLLIPFFVSGQRYISGKVTDSADGNPIPNASVFLAETTVGINSDSAGYFRLALPGPGSYRLVVSHVGYQTFFGDIESDWVTKEINVSLQIVELEELTVSQTIKFRKEDIYLFWNTVLGVNPSKNRIFASNPEAVYFYYNRQTKILKVTCREPLKIINLETGYQIIYVLDRFIHDYNNQTTSWDAQYMFYELEPKNIQQKNAWEKNREKIHKVSIPSFIKALYTDSLSENGFFLINISKTHIIVPLDVTNNKYMKLKNSTLNFNYSSIVNTDNLISIDSVNNVKMINIHPDSSLLLICYGEKLSKKEFIRKVNSNSHNVGTWSSIGLFQNEVETPNGAVYIFPDGTVKNILRFTPMRPNKSLTGLNMMLPIEYNLDLRLNETDIISENSSDRGNSTKIVNQTNPFSETAETVYKRFDTQLSLFPQEKVYLQTDKPYFLAGERIWFRAHVVDAASHQPGTAECVYVELYNALDSVVYRVKTGIDNDAYSGYMLIPEDAPEGDYTIRAYTNTMRNLDEDYFFLKNIRIAHPLTRLISATPTFNFGQRSRDINAGIRFADVLNASPVTPEAVKISINSGKPMNAPGKSGASDVSFSLPANEKQRVMLLDAQYNNRPYRKYIRIPVTSEDFDVTFYPEGGQALYGCTGRMAFKAMQQDGTAININGILYDGKDNEINRFKTDVRGMGILLFTPVMGEKYYAVCTNSKGQSKRFDLPEAQTAGYALSTTWVKDNLMVRIVQPDAMKTTDTLYLLIHTRGMVQDIFTLENTGKTIALLKASFPSGISNLLLLSKDKMPLSERLIFVNNNDQARVESTTDRDEYSTGSPVEYTVSFTDETGDPLEGAFSVSVTDDHAVTVDTTANILTSLLLSSDLRGYIPDPAFFFRDDAQSKYAVDLLMLTQGWRRYDTERIVRGDFLYPDSLYGKGFEITGTVQRKQLLRTVPEANAEVEIMSLDGDYFGSTVTDDNGRFSLFNGGLTDSVRFMVRATTKTDNQNLILTLDSVSYPERIIPVIAFEMQDNFFTYADKAEQQYVNEHGTRHVQLDEVVVTTKNQPVKSRSSFYTYADRTITESEIEKLKLPNMGALLMHLGVMISETGEDMSARYGDPPILLVDDFPVQSIVGLNINNISRVEVVTSQTARAVARAITGSVNSTIVSIYTKQERIKLPPPRTDIANIIPLGFQNPVAFYAPKYDSPLSDAKPDLRTTIHWQPNLTIGDDGKAMFRFCTADTPSTYSVVIEGITTDGKIIYKKDRITVIKDE